ncbi:CopL family metal-binding regulatory protein [Pseudoxanthomonas beigongshangi]
MSLPSLLLRIVLSVTLLVSGTGNAVAALQMHLAQASLPHHGHAMDDCAMRAMAEPAMSAPCHDVDGSRVAPEPAPVQDHGQPDCCSTGHCDGFCAQQAPATMPAAWAGNGPRASADPLGPVPTGHPAPPLPSPQRPPIA